MKVYAVSWESGYRSVADGWGDEILVPNVKQSFITCSSIERVKELIKIADPKAAKIKVRLLDDA